MPWRPRDGRAAGRAARRALGTRRQPRRRNPSRRSSPSSTPRWRRARSRRHLRESPDTASALITRVGAHLRYADRRRAEPADPGLVDAMGDDHALALHPPGVADLLDLRVDEQIGIAALQRPRPKRVDLLVEALADPADLAATDAQLVDAATAEDEQAGTLGRADRGCGAGRRRRARQGAPAAPRASSRPRSISSRPLRRLR